MKQRGKRWLLRTGAGVLGAASLPLVWIFLNSSSKQPSFFHTKTQTSAAKARSATEPQSAAKARSATEPQSAVKRQEKARPALSAEQKLRRLKNEGLAASLKAENLKSPPLDLILRRARGKTLVLNLWATWCAPCVEELPALAALADKTQDTALVAAISTESEETARRFFEKAFPDLKGKILALSVEKASLLRIFPEEPLPSTYLFNRKGRLFQKEAGPRDWSLERYRSLVQNPPP